jgi:tripartite-type tricarboxylate transporter receptor subunit TctC
LTGVVAGDTQLALDNVAAVPLIQSGKLRALAQTGKTPSTHLPDVPTFAEAGLPQFDVTATWGLLAPVGVPAPIVAKLNDALVRAVNDPQLRESLLAQGITPDPGSAQQFGVVLATETERLSKLIDDAKIQP